MFGQILLFAASVTVCAARLHGHNLNPAAVTQELNRCLSAVRVAASRRGSSAPAVRARRGGSSPGQTPPQLEALTGG